MRSLDQTLAYDTVNFQQETCGSLLDACVTLHALST
jgi:hypothetical protein